jgi:hypothetical protein
MNLWNILREHLGRPEYVHVLINPLPVYGLAIALVALIIALVLRNRVALVMALAVVIMTSLSAWPTYVYGEGYDRVKATSDKVGEQWLDKHMARGERFIAAYYVLAGLALLAMVAPVKWPRSSVPLTAVPLIIRVGVLVIGVWIAYSGGRVRHKEFRFEPPPSTRARDH